MDGSATAALIELPADAFGVSRRSVRVVGGQRSRSKVVEVVGIGRGANGATGNGQRDVIDSSPMIGEPICLLLVGSDGALLEGLSQSLGALGYATMATQELRDARDLASTRMPLIAVVEANLAAISYTDALGIPLAPGGALVLYNVTGNAQSPVLAPTLQRAVLANITLPLERQRLVALVQHVAERVRTTGRRRDTPPERTAP